MTGFFLLYYIKSGFFQIIFNKPMDQKSWILLDIFSRMDQKILFMVFIFIHGLTNVKKNYYLLFLMTIASIKVDL